MPSNILSKAALLLESGKRSEAKHLLDPVLQSEPQNLKAWALYLKTATTTPERIDVLERCLKDNPDHLKAQQLLASLKASQSDVVALPRSSAKLADLREPEPVFPHTVTRIEGNRTNRNVLLLIALTIVVLCVAIVWLVSEVNHLKKVNDDLVSVVTSLDSDVSSIVSKVNSMASELSTVGALARNADHYAHSHTYSDARLKQDVVDLDSSLQGILKLRSVTFNWSTDKYPEMNFSKAPQVGFLAQEVEQIFPNLVSTDAKGYKAVNYDGLIPYLTGAIKEQQGMITSLQEQVAALNARVKALENSGSSTNRP